jgi:hypothetical protein
VETHIRGGEKNLQAEILPTSRSVWFGLIKRRRWNGKEKACGIY